MGGPRAPRASARGRSSVNEDPQSGAVADTSPRPQCAFKMPMIGAVCSSHCVSQLAALFIDVRAE